MFCVACGAQLPDGSLFCFRCGRRHDADLETPGPYGMPFVEPAVEDGRPLGIKRIRDAAGISVGFILGAIGLIISLEIAAAVAFWTWRTFGPLSLIVTFELWFAVPFWYAWRWVIGHLTGWGWPV